jgi:hypothetical protein
MVPPSHPLDGTDADCEGCENREAEGNVEKVKHRQLLQECQEQVGEDRVRKLWERRTIRVKNA